MKTLFPFLIFWIEPRQTINRLNLSYTILDDLRLVILLSLSYIFQISLFIYINDTIPASVFLSAKGLMGISWTMIALAAGIYTYTNLSALMAWKIAILLGGKGSLVNTRTAMLWSLVSYLPVGFSLLFIYFAYTLKLIGQPIFLLGPLSLIAFPCLFTYSSILTLRLFSETHRFPIRRALACLLLCLSIQGGIVYLLLL
jgi:hypothetical protein